MAVGPEEDELAFLRDWSLCIVRFICGLSGATELCERFETEIQAAADRGNLRGLKIAAHDNAEWAKDLPPKQHRKLDVLLATKFGKGLTDAAATVEQEIAEILRASRIENEDQYRLLQARADAIYDDEDMRDELELINGLLAAYN